MALQFEDGPEGRFIVRTYLTDDGAQGAHYIPLEAVATRMAMLGYDSPAPALDAIMQEVALINEGSAVNVYGCVYAALSENADLASAQEQARAALEAPLGPDGRDMAQFKDALCGQYAEDLLMAGKEFLQAHRPTIASPT